MTHSYLNDALFIIRFRLKKMFMHYSPMKKTEPSIAYGRHRVRIIARKGRFLLTECRNCGDRELAADKIEAMGIYNRVECRRVF